MDRELDGNAAAGALSEVFTAEMTLALTTCSTCAHTRPLGELTAYVEAPGIVLRCASCGAVQIRLVRTGDRAWLDVRGVRVLELRVPGPSA